MTKSTISRERVVALIAEHSYDSALVDALEHLLAAMASEHKRNPVLAYADSYRDMAKQGVESVPIWSVITDLERNIAPLYRHAQPAPVVPPEQHWEELCRQHPDMSIGDAIIRAAWWNHCRAAMLQAKSLASINPAPAMGSLPETGEVLHTNSPVITDEGGYHYRC